MKVEINREFKRAFELMENTSDNVFITGRASTGKSTLLQYFRQKTNKNMVVLAPTGVAAVNIKGQTIHSFFKFGINITLDNIPKVYGQEAKIYQEVDVIVIDEVSMVRADLLDCVDKFMRKNGPDENRPFGGADKRRV